MGTMPTNPAAVTLRNRAAGLRALARQLERSSLHDLVGWVGSDTWMGPSPQRCADDVRLRSGQLRSHATDLRARATRLEDRAHQLESAEPVRVGGPR
jgi:hypothetical protein